jgi:NTP pyrophosphatase (non-canonical NTP hydrolase)
MSNPELSLDQLVTKIARWGYDRKITTNGKVETQMLKLTEEVGELAGAIAKKKGSETADGIGDVTVVLIMLCELKGLDFHACVQHAYNEIKDRKGYLSPEGVFIREE